jgi:hypothetical protein
MPSDKNSTRTFSRRRITSRNYASPFTRLIYPIPATGLAFISPSILYYWTVAIWPDVEWVNQVDYKFELARAEGFYAAI